MLGACIINFAVLITHVSLEMHRITTTVEPRKIP